MKSHEEPVSEAAIRPGVSATWQVWEAGGVYPPTEKGDRGPVPPDEYISREWLSGQ